MMKKRLCLLALLIGVLCFSACGIVQRAKDILYELTQEDTHATGDSDTLITEPLNTEPPTEETTIPPIEPETLPKPTNPVPYTTEISGNRRIYQAPDPHSSVVQSVGETGIYTIMEEVWDAEGNRWGRLKSGLGWVILQDGMCTCSQCDGYFPYIGLYADGLCEECYFSNSSQTFASALGSTKVWRIDWYDDQNAHYGAEFAFEAPNICHVQVDAAGMECIGYYSGNYRIDENMVYITIDSIIPTKTFSYLYDPIHKTFTQQTTEGLAYYHAWGESFPVRQTDKSIEDITGLAQYFQ